MPGGADPPPCPGGSESESESERERERARERARDGGMEGGRGRQGEGGKDQKETQPEEKASKRNTKSKPTSVSCMIQYVRARQYLGSLAGLLG